MNASTATIRTRTGTVSSPEELTADRITKSLLGYGVIAGPSTSVTSLAQALTREGFDLPGTPWSLLANGGPGWIQIANFVVTGLMADRVRGRPAPRAAHRARPRPGRRGWSRSTG